MYCYSVIFLIFQMLVPQEMPNARKIERRFIEISPSVRVSIYEVTNEEFRRFILSSDSYSLYDSLSWQKIPNTEEFQNLYHWHPAFKNYPAVNVTPATADAYCAWLTSYYNNLPRRRYNAVFRLPSEKEWQQATASAGLASEGNLKREGPSPELFDYISDGFVYQAPVGKYKPLGNGIYDAVGNVSEITAGGKIKGGNFTNLIHEALPSASQDLELPDPRVGFRVVMEILPHPDR